MPSDVMASTPKQRKMPKVVEHISIAQAKNGGHTVRHHYTSTEHSPEEHVFAVDQGHELVQHLAKHAGIKLDTEAHAGSEENVDKKEKAEL